MENLIVDKFDPVISNVELLFSISKGRVQIQVLDSIGTIARVRTVSGYGTLLLGFFRCLHTTVIDCSFTYNCY